MRERDRERVIKSNGSVAVRDSFLHRYLFVAALVDMLVVLIVTFNTWPKKGFVWLSNMKGFVWLRNMTFVCHAQIFN